MQDTNMATTNLGNNGRKRKHDEVSVSLLAATGKHCLDHLYDPQDGISAPAAAAADASSKDTSLDSYFEAKSQFSSEAARIDAMPMDSTVENSLMAPLGEEQDSTPANHEQTFEVEEAAATLSSMSLTTTSSQARAIAKALDGDSQQSNAGATETSASFDKKVAAMETLPEGPSTVSSGPQFNQDQQQWSTTGSSCPPMPPSNMVTDQSTLFCPSTIPTPASMFDTPASMLDQDQRYGVLIENPPWAFTSTMMEGKNLIINGETIGDEEAMALARALETNATLKELELRGNSIGDVGVTALARALESNTTLETVLLWQNSIGNEGTTALARALESNTTLKELHLWRNSIGNEGATALARALESNTTLEGLYLQRNSIGNEGATAFARALESNATLETLNLFNNSIGIEGASALARALESNSTLKELDVSWNSIGNEGATALARALETNTTLKMLGLRDNLIGNEGAMALARALESNTVLKTLDLYNNSIGNEGAKALLETLQRHNGTIQRIFLSGNDIPSLVGKQIEDIVEMNREGTRSPQPTSRPRMYRLSLPNSERVVITESNITNKDILCSGDFDLLTHPGNVLCLLAGKRHKAKYESLDAQDTESLVYEIVHELVDGGSRFVKKKQDGNYELLTKREAREKVESDVQREPPMHPPNTVSPPNSDRLLSVIPRESINVADITDNDVYCGQKYSQSTHAGNVEYLNVISKLKPFHQDMGQNDKKDFADLVVALLLGRGCRFVKKSASDGTFVLLTKKEVRTKVGQMLKNKGRKKKKKLST